MSLTPAAFTSRSVPTGGKHWRWKYRYTGKERRLALGSYPDVPLAQARRDRDAARDAGAAWDRSVQAKRDTKMQQQLPWARRSKPSRACWFEHWKAPRSAATRRLRDAPARAGRVPYARTQAHRRDHRAAPAGHGEAHRGRDALDIAKRSLQTCGQIFALRDRARGHRAQPGCGRSSRATRSRRGRRTNYARLDAEGVARAAAQDARVPGPPFTRYALHLIALTFVRTSELIEARWAEFDLDAAEWRIPAERMKMRTPHTVPLSTQAVDLLRCLHELRGLSAPAVPGRARPREADDQQHDPRRAQAHGLCCDA